MGLSVVRRLSTGASVTALLAATFVALTVSSASGVTTCVASQADDASAVAMAAACGAPVEDLSQRTETTSVLANPDSTHTATIAEVPVRVRQGSAWADVDLTLRTKADGSVEPVAHPLGLLLSGPATGGGSHPLATLGSGTRAVTMSWTGALPNPTLSGSTATYPSVRPGIDLVVTASTVGFEEYLVLRDRSAVQYLAGLALRLSSPAEATATMDSLGHVELMDSAGVVLASSPGATMWDSQVSAASGDHNRVSDVPTSLSGITTGQASLVLSPDTAWLNDAATVYPVTVDPAVSVPTVFDTFVQTGFSSDQSGSKELKLGFSDDGTSVVARSFITWNVSAIRGKHVLSATLSLWENWSWSCRAANWEIWTTDPFDASVRINHQPTWRFHDGDTSGQTKGHDSGCNPGWVASGATGFFRRASTAGCCIAYMGLKATSESNHDGWKRFVSRNGDAAKTPRASVTYNSYPALPSSLNTAAQGCAGGAGRPVVATGTPTLSAYTGDPDTADRLTVTFGWEVFNSTTGAWATSGSMVQSGVLPNTTVSKALTSAVATGGIYRWRVESFDGHDTTAWSAYCEFEVDTVKPNTPKVTPDTGNGAATAGKTVRLAFAPGGSPADTDVTGYNWWVVDGAGTHPTVWAAGSTATVDWTPPVPGQGVVHIQAKDRVNLDAVDATYAFNAAQPNTERARWPLNEAAGTTLSADSTGNGHSVALTLDAASGLGRPGRIVGGPTVLSLDGGATNNVATTGAIVDTSRSFTVTAWARLTSKSANFVVAGQASSGTNSGFLLEYVAATDRWALVTVDQSTGAVTGSAASGASPRTGVWTHLAGTYDSAADTLRLYVNGAPVSTVSGVANWNAAGTFRIGPGGAGDIGDVRVWDRVLIGSEVATMADPLSTSDGSNVGRWHMDEGTGPVAYDSSNFFHDINLNLGTGVGWTATGHSGSALSFNGTGMATTDGTVVYTDQSFTVSAWVRLTTVNTGVDEAILSEGGTNSSAFKLFLDHNNSKWTWAVVSADASTGATWYGAVSDAVVQPGVWYHLVGVYDAYSGEVRLYVGTTATPVPQAVKATGATAFRATSPLKVGALGTPTAASSFLNGAVDEVNLYAGVVPDAEIPQLP